MPAAAKAMLNQFDVTRGPDKDYLWYLERVSELEVLPRRAAGRCSRWSVTVEKE